MPEKDTSQSSKSPHINESPIPAEKLPTQEANAFTAAPGATPPADSQPEVPRIPLGEQWGVKENGELKKPEEIPAQPRHLFRGLIVFLVAVALLVGGAYFAYSLLGKKAAEPATAVEIFHEGRIYTGQPFLISVTARNISDVALSDAKVAIDLPDDIFVADEQDTRKRSLEEQIGSMAPGETKSIDFSLVAAGEGQTVKELSAVFSYAAQTDAKLVYEKKSSIELPVGQSSAALTFNVPSATYSGESIRIVVKYQNNAALPLKNAKLELTYPLPPSFTFASSSRPASRGNALFDLGNLEPGSSQSLTIEGSISGTDKSFTQFHAALYADIYGVSRIVSGQDATITIMRRPLEVKVVGKDRAESALAPGDKASYSVVVNNNSRVVLSGVRVKATLTGAMLDAESVDVPQGTFSPRTRTINWDSGSVSSLASIPPGGQVDLAFSAGVLKAYPGVSPSDKNYALTFFAEAESPTVPQGTSASRTYASFESVSKIRGTFSAAAKAYWRDAASKMINTGPYPPRVDVPTRYTIHWIINTLGGDAENIIMRSSLPTGVTWTNSVKSNVSSAPSFNPQTNIVTWEIPNLSSGYGGTLPAAEAIFQVEATPSQADIARAKTILGKTDYSGVDSFTKIQQTGSDEMLTTYLPDDTTLGTDRSVKK